MVILLTQKLKGLKNYYGHFTHSAKLLVLCTVNEKVAAGVDNKQKVWNSREDITPSQTKFVSRKFL